MLKVAIVPSLGKGEHVEEKGSPGERTAGVGIQGMPRKHID